MLKKPSTKQKNFHHPDLVFWACLLALNSLLFLPLYLFNRETTTFLPFQAGSLTEIVQQLVVWRNNLDMFRLNAEIPLLTAFWVLVPWLRTPRKSRWFRRLFLAVYVAALSYYLYESIMLSLYQSDPVFYSHYRLVVDGLQMIAHSLKIPLSVYAIGLGGLMVGLLLIGWLVRTLVGGIPVEQLSRGSRIGLVALALVMGVYLLTQQTALASPKMVISSFGYKLQKNLQESVRVRRQVTHFDDTSLQTIYNYNGYTLLKKPNIYLIFVESYGSVLYRRPDYKDAYLALLAELEPQLQAAGWHAASTLSESPTWGGGSWMAYTSALFGLRVDTHPQYLALVDKYQSETYPDLGQFLQSQGYDTTWLSSISEELDEAKWQAYQNFHKADHWLHYSDLNYTGPHYGWGPAPPDQYALNFARETVINKSENPSFLFFITQNSHFPWVPLPEPASDWRSFNEMMGEPEIPPVPTHQAKRQNYLNAINYQLRFLTDYILQTGDEESIFILIGDHQPQQVSRRNDSFDTPLHIISKDAALVEAFLAYDFVPGLAVQDMATVTPPTATMRHEGLYSMVARVLVAQYGQGNKVLPPYFPNGIPLEKESAKLREGAQRENF